ncbi:hypothetical protein FISHEDRAFT_61297 [Fistulina hepatica ATCC 64428]|uniref:Uncharacterized protein n=1 Tax=Fistulina hepatica ATCC 64428 TaxID=1128425 RepID=A0A0D7A5Y6_9AGAR|nr:hypothetical protein FISHEDRAFT_61297 [Fistulina hepatica ATCC 64428]
MSTGTDAVQNSDCEFRQAGPGIFIRRCIGFEERTAKAGKDLAMFVGGSSAVQVRYRAGGQGFDLRRALASTWTLLRLDAPFMATVTEKTLFHAQQENQATVSSSSQQVAIRFSELTEGKGVMANIEWGEEVARLPPAIAVSLLGKDGIRNAIRQEAAEPAPPAAPGVLTAMDWIPKHAVSGSIAAMIVLRRTAAAKLRDTYKRQGWTLADVLTTMSVVAQLQTALDVSRMKGADYFTDIRAAYEKAPAYIVPIYAVDTPWP